MMARRRSQAQAAFDRAQLQAAAGDPAGALRLLQYAQRQAPSDAAVTLAIGTIRLQLRDPQAIEAFTRITARFDLREAWLGVAAAHQLAGRWEEACAALGRALSRHAPSPEAATQAFQDGIARASGRPGWCGLSADGTLLVSLATAAAALELRLDGRKVAQPPRDAGGHRLRVRLPAAWRTAASLSVTSAGAALIGSPITVAAIAAVEGFVTVRDRGLTGWAWHPGDAEREAILAIRAVGGDGPALRIVAAADMPDLDHPTLLARPRGFTVPAVDLAGFDGPVDVLGESGRALYGSPLDPAAEARSAAAACALVRALLAPVRGGVPDIAHLSMPGVAAEIAGPPPSARPVRRHVDVVIPIYRGLAETLACLDSVLDGGEKWMRVLVVEDASPDPALVAAMQKLAAAGRITLVRQAQNGGFPRAVNAGLAATAADRDVVLLNSDTLVPRGWLARLREAALSAPDIGTVTPLSNDATIMSYPCVDAVNDIPDLAATARLDALARAANGREVIDIPTAIGFCMYIRRDCLNDVGPMRADVFAQGYGEENDFCLRARHLGWRHVGLTGLFVGHVGGTSFGAAKLHLITRNLAVLNRLHPGYDAMIAAFQDADPLAGPRRRMDQARWREGRRDAGSLLLMTHDRVGGVLRRVRARCDQVRDQGLRPVILTPRRLSDGRSLCLVGDGSEAGYPNLGFRMPEEMGALVALLDEDRPRALELHHFIGHDPAMTGLATRLGIPCDVVVHDYSWFCPRITLVGAADRYCGEPDLAGCEACCADLGGRMDEAIGPTALVARSQAILDGARRILAPAADVARRMRAHFPRVRPDVEPWEDDCSAPLPAGRRAIRAEGPVRVCLVGAIGTEKGYDLLLGCARDSVARKLALHFVLVGYSMDDARLQATGAVEITGPYEEDEAVGLIRDQRADLALLPSIWPETWSYVLTHIWSAGLPAVAFDLGAPAERIRNTGRGWLIPLGIGPQSVNNALLAHGATWRARDRPDPASRLVAGR